jgi:hypothetical protein
MITEEQQIAKDMETAVRAKCKELGMEAEATTGNPDLVPAVVYEATQFMDNTFDLPSQEIAIAAVIGAFLNQGSPHYEELRATLERQIGRLVIEHIAL